MENLKRYLKLKLPAGQSAFLWGPRKTGKSTYLKQHFKNSLVYDFLNTDLFFEFTKNPSLLRQQLLAASVQSLKHPVILDEVQKVPGILDEVHWLIENRKVQFILCGSSARKLKRGQANLLGGRAWRYEMFPLVSTELPRVDLYKALNQGMVPAHYLSSDAKKSLKAYVQDYLKEEVFDEGLTRNIPAFSRFFEAMAYSHGQVINFSNIARDCGVDSKTVQEYYQILIDTLLGHRLEPFKQRQDRSVIIKAPKFYLFDTGIAGAIVGRNIEKLKGEEFGRVFEHFIFMELTAYRGYKDLDFAVHYWRTKTGLEVDFVLGAGEIAIEIKGGRADIRDIHGLKSFKEKYKPKKSIVVCQEKIARIDRGIEILPWQEFLQRLWAGKII